MTKKIQDIDPKKGFKVPEGYFENFEDRLLVKIREEESGGSRAKKYVTYLRPYFALAASIAGIALITYMVLRTVPESFISSSDTYSIELIDEAGIINDESVLVESYNEIFNDEYTDWEKEAMTYLASSDADLSLLLE